MSYKAVFQLFLQIHQFINIDLPSQGIYQLRVSVYQQQSKQKIYAIPFQFMEINKKPMINSKKIQQLSRIQPPYFLTKSGSIKYSDQKLLYQDQIRFKLEIQSFPRLHSQNIILQFQLIFSQFCYTSSNILQTQIKIVQNKKFRLDNLQLGQFVGNYSSKFTFTLFACLSNFKFGKYKLISQLQNIDKMDQNGQIIIDKDKNNKNNDNVRKKQLQRSKITSFQEFLKWVRNYYNDKVPNPLEYFYKTYVKNLRYYFYLAQQKLNQNSIIKQKKILKVPKQFLQLPTQSSQKHQHSSSSSTYTSTSTQTQVSQKQFHKYITNYQPNNLTSNSILQQINIIYSDIYMFLMQIQKQFQLDQLMINKMKKQYQTYIKQRYGDRVFKYTLKNGDSSCSSKQNKKIAERMRQKQANIITYPIQDIDFIQGKQALEYLFYQITDPKILNNKNTNKQQKQQQKQTKSAYQQSNISKQNYNKKYRNKTVFTLIQNPFVDYQNIVKQKQQQIQNISRKQTNNTEIQSFKNKVEQQKQQLNKIKNRQAMIIQGNVYDKQVKKLQMKQQQQNYDIYSDVNLEKGSVDSEMTEKSFESENANKYPSQIENQQFSDISQIQCKSNIKKRTQKLLQMFQIPKLKYNEKNMLIIMCHGFQGSSYDMTVLLRGLRQLMPNASYLTARSNQGKTEGDIEQMGQRLASQVQNYILNYMEEQNVILNFIGHSMGGIIARAAIKHLVKKYYDKFGFFCTLSTPHLGYLNGVDGMIKAGLWAILKFKPIKSLQQLKMDDSKDFRKSYLYKLSKQGSLKRFRKIILFSSFEDSYVSWHSARISAHRKKNDVTKIEQEMVSNILGNQQIHRVDVNFNVQTKNLDSFIGRTAHINLIIQQSLFKIIKSAIPQLFDISKF